MGKRDWGGTVLVACLIALAGLLHSHMVPVVLLCAGAVVSATVVVWDVCGKKPAICVLLLLAVFGSVITWRAGAFKHSTPRADPSATAQRAAHKTRTTKGRCNTVIGNVGTVEGEGNTVIGPTEANGDVRLEPSPGGTAYGRNAHAGPRSLAVGCNAGAGGAKRK